MKISSVKNERVKQVAALQQKSALRRECGLMVVEGRRELEHCLEAGHSVRTLYICPELAGDAHDYIGYLHSGQNEEFNRDYQKAHDEYFSRLNKLIEEEKKQDADLQISGK